MTRAALIKFTLLFAYLLWFRTYGIGETFWLRGDQIRDWDAAVRSFGDLPLSGVPSTAGGTTLGPAYYWFLWLVAHIVGPFTSYAPHAGGFGVAVLQSAADGVLLLALLRQLRSQLLAVAIVLGAATSGYDATLSGMIWNPPAAAAFGKLAIAAVLWDPTLTLFRSGGAVLASWLAVQCHTSALIVAIPVIGWVVMAPAFARQWRPAAARLAVAAGIILALQVPWIVVRFQSPPTEGNRIVNSISAVLDAPAASIHPIASARFVARSLHFTLVVPFDADRTLQATFGIVVFAAAIATLVMLRDTRVAAMSVGPLATALALFAFWQGPLEEVYWCLVLTLPAALALLAWMDGLRPRLQTACAALALGLVVLAQPARAEMAWTFHRLPQYGPLLRGCRAGEVRRPAGLPDDVDVAWLCGLISTARPSATQGVADGP